MNMEFTASQLKAIETRGSNLLVSAAAGSGKTAVLVERIIRRLKDKEDPIDISRLLVVTFTNAAAAEMKEKIIKELKRSKSADMQKMLREADNADIMTMDSFCIKCVRNNFNALGIDPGVSVCDDSEAAILMDEAVEELFDSLYESEDSELKKAFYHLTSLYSSNKNDDGLKNQIITIYNFTDNFAEPEKWLDEKAALYDVDDIADSLWMHDIIGEYVRYAKRFVSGTYNFVNDIEKIYDIGELPKKDVMLKTYDLAVEVSKLDCNGDVKECLDKICGINECFDSMEKAKPISRNATDEVRSVNDQCGDYVKKFKKDILTPLMAFTDIEGENSKLSEMAVAVKELVMLVKKFTEVYDHKKELRGIMKFSDFEHLTYKLFCMDEYCKEYRDKYDEILIDEYQDTNGLQDAIFAKISHKNMFVVGDLKQSIYRFRGGNPFIFKERSGKYESGDGGIRIALSDNFRSRSEVLDGINSVFDFVMSDEVGDVDYSGGERLNCGNKSYLPNNDSHKCELHVILNDSGEDKAICEAEHVADIIKDLLESKFKVTDRNGETHAIKKKDIVILASSTSAVSNIYREALDSRGIDAYVEEVKYFDRPEISTMMSLISVISNSRQDIPLIAVMRSPIGNFSVEELTKIRLASMQADEFYDALMMYADTPCAENDLASKCRDFISSLERWNDYRRYKSVAGLIWSIYEETGFYDFMGAFDKTGAAQANLKLLHNRAQKYEENGFKGLFNFIKYIEKIENDDDDRKIRSANLVGEAHDVVRMMTIHKSKGLEFPVVILTGTGKKFSGSSNENSTAEIILHRDAGFGLRYISSDRTYRSETIPQICAMTKDKDENKSEELRKLYVALTRAKEKLIVTGVVNPKTSQDAEKMFSAVVDRWSELSKNTKMEPADSAEAESFLDWLVPAVIKNDKWTLITKKFTKKRISDILSFKYKYDPIVRFPNKTSVSSIKALENRTVNHEFDYSLKKTPRFLEPVKAANEIGTAHHKIMELIGLTKEMDPDYVKSEISRIKALGEISDDDEKYISADFILEFFESELGKRMIKAAHEKKLYREASFETEINVSDYEEELINEIELKEEKMLLQGTIDCYFIEDGEAVLVDYKTDRFKGDLNDPEEVKAFNAEKMKMYKVQLDLYQRAIENIVKIKVKEKYLYLFSVKNAVLAE